MINNKKLPNKISWPIVLSIILLLLNGSIAIYSKVLCFLIFIYTPLGFISCLALIILAIIKIIKKQKNGFSIILINLFTILICAISIFQTPPHYLTEKDLVIKGFHKSPNNKNIIIEYMNGSRDGITRTVIIKYKNKDKQDLTKYELPRYYNYSKWINDDSAEFIIYSNSKEFKKNKNYDIIFNDVKIITHIVEPVSN